MLGFNIKFICSKMIYSKPYFLNADAQKEKFARAQEVYSEREEFQKRKKRDEERKHK